MREGRSGKGEVEMEKKRVRGCLLCNRGRLEVVPPGAGLWWGVRLTSGHCRLLGPRTTEGRASGLNSLLAL